MANVTRAQANRYFKAFCQANITPDDVLSNIAMPELVENFDGHRWSIYWDWANFYGDFGEVRTVRPEVDYLWTECVNSQRIALYPL